MRCLLMPREKGIVSQRAEMFAFRTEGEASAASSCTEPGTLIVAVHGLGPGQSEAGSEETRN